MIKTFLKGQYGSNNIVPNSNFWIFETYKIRGFVRNVFSVLSLIRILWTFETNKKYFLIEPSKHNMGQTVLSFDQNLLETLENATQIGKQSLYWGQHESNFVVSNSFYWIHLK